MLVLPRHFENDKLHKMNNYEEIETKIASLGGVQENPSCRASIVGEEYTKSLNEFELLFSSVLPEAYKHFYGKYGPCAFVNSVKIKCEETVPAANDMNEVSVDYFYAIRKEGECSIGRLLNQYADQMPKGLLPICDGEIGDLICIDLRKGNSFGRVVYWYHEGDLTNDIFTVAKSFTEFLLKLELRNEVDQSNELVEKMKVEISPDLLNLLKGSGYGPK